MRDYIDTGHEIVVCLEDSRGRDLYGRYRDGPCVIGVFVREDDPLRHLARAGEWWRVRVGYPCTMSRGLYDATLIDEAGEEEIAARRRALSDAGE